MTDFSDADIAEGRRLVTDLTQASWGLGDLAVRVAGPSPARAGVKDGGYEAIAELAVEIGITPRKLQECRQVASRWAPEDRIERCSFSIHRALVADNDRAETLSRYVKRCADNESAPTVKGLKTFVAESTQEPWRRDADEFGRGIRENTRKLIEIVLRCLVEEDIDPDDGEAVVDFIDLESKLGPYFIDYFGDEGTLAQGWKNAWERHRREFRPADPEPFDE